MVDLVRLPDNIEAGAHGGPNFTTSVITLVNGRENRNQEWATARHSWDIGYGVTDEIDFKTVRAFFYARRGKARAFLFKDWSDYTGTLEAVAAVTGDATKRQLVKTYPDALAPYLRLIEYPVAGTLHVYVDTLETFAYTLGDKGVITFTGGDPGVNVFCTFEFDVPVRFDVDQFNVTVQNVLAMEIPSLPVVEVTND
jgi:uncharacterized protein (TIGR02217 family)